MLVKKKSHIVTEPGKPKMYLVTIVNEKHVSWDFCMRMLTGIFHKSAEEATSLTHEIITYGEALCGGYVFEIAESKAVIVEKHAKLKGFSLYCLIEEV